MKCERCEKNPARVRIDQIVDGRREQHYLCQSCVDELMSAAMGQMGGFDGDGIPEGSPFGFNRTVRELGASRPGCWRHARASQLLRAGNSQQQ